MAKIQSINSIQILDSRGIPTLETTVKLQDGTLGSASVPSGKSTGTHEAVELRDRDTTHFYGKGVTKAINNVHDTIAHHLKGENVMGLKEIDKKLIDLDGTENKSRLGANAILSVSLATARALAASQKQPLWKTLNKYYFADVKPALPSLMMNIINGGAHAAWTFDIQEYMIIPQGENIKQNLEIASEVFHALEQLLKAEGHSTGLGDEGGFAPKLKSNFAPFDYIARALQKTDNKQSSIAFAIDAAASEFYSDDKYHLKKKGKKLNSSELSKYYQKLISDYQLLSIEDPFAEEDWDAFAEFTKEVGERCLVVGDDLYTTNVKLIKQGIEKRATNSVLIKPNQIGTLYETIQAIKMTKDTGWKVIISHRSGETKDSFIADLSVACGADFLKAGSVSRSERLAKYNRLLEIENKGFSTPRVE
ncbi:MAG: phosphopyruvate hydratase [Candidatus Paceibacterota bacterium]